MMGKEIAAGFAFLSTVISAWAISGTGVWKCMDAWRRRAISGLFGYLALLELIIFIQYYVIDQCDSLLNNLLTQFAWYHLCFQPVFTNWAFSAVDYSGCPNRKTMWSYIVKLSIVGGMLVAIRMIVPAWFPIISDTLGDEFMAKCTEKAEGFCGTQTCATTGEHLIRWTFQLNKHSYTFPNMNFHLFLMFVLPLANGTFFGPILMLLTGPVAVYFLTDVSQGERAAIWSLFSVLGAIVSFGVEYLVSSRAAKTRKQA